MVFWSPCTDLPFPVFISPQYRWANAHLLCKAFWKLQTRGTPLPWKITLLCSVYPLVQPLQPRDPCELHFQAGVATAAAGDCATALMSERKKHVGQFLENKPWLELWCLCSKDKDVEKSLQAGFFFLVVFHSTLWTWSTYALTNAERKPSLQSLGKSL